MGLHRILFFSFTILASCSPFVEGFQGNLKATSIVKKERNAGELQAIPFMESVRASWEVLHRTDLSHLDPIIKSEVFSTAAHVSLDLGTFIVPVTPLSVQFLAVIGRLFCIASDYIPDHTMLPEEFAYQVSMLAISSSALAQSLKTVVNANRQVLTMRDRKCFASLFRPAGVTMMHFKMLLATAFEWQELSKGSIVTSDEPSTEEQNYLYWLYDGELEVKAKGKALQTIAPKTKHILGNLSFAANTHGKKKTGKAVAASPQMPHDISKSPNMTTRVKSETAQILRVDTRRLQELMTQDEFLDQAIHNLLFDSMQQRIADLVKARQIMAQEQEKRHRQYFEHLFQSTGVSWNQYKRLLSQSAVELRHAEAGSILATPVDDSNRSDKGEDRHYLHWVCEGELKIYNHDTGKVLQTLTPATGHLFGDLNNSPVVPSSLCHSYDSVYSNSSVRVCGKDSVVLTMDAEKMKQLTEEDKSFKLATQTLMYIQEQTVLSTLDTKRSTQLKP